MNFHLYGTGSLHPQFWTDFHATLFATPGTLLEIAFASKGGSVFNTAIYHEALTLDKLKQYAQTDCNVALLPGCNPKYLLAPKGERTKRLATNQCIRHKNYLIFDLDFKANIPNYKDLDKETRRKSVAEFLEVLQSKILSESLPVWFVNFSGNGVHLYFKLANPMETHNPNDYKDLYHGITHYLTGLMGMEFDPACSNPARLIRMPGSTNWKDIAEPIPCEILYYAEDIFADEMVSKFAKKIDLPKPRNFQGKDELLRKLDLVKVLKFFDYPKTDSITETKDKIICSSPLSHDKSPSFHYDKSTQLFYDFSTAKGGDLFSLIALQAGLEIKSDFRKVLQYAKKIAGLLEEGRESRGRYELKDTGVWFLASNEDTPDGSQWVCSYLDVLGLSRNLQGQGWGRILQIRDTEGTEKTWPMPMDMLAGDGLELRKKLLNLGVQINPVPSARNHLVQYLSEKNPNRFFRAINQLGWYQQSFVLPEVIIQKDEAQSHVLLSDPAQFSRFLALGDLDTWKTQVAHYAAGNPLLQLALAAAFSAPLLNLTGDENFGFHLVGPSSVGKTITLDVAGSVWGGGGIKGYKTRWRATLNGLEGLAAKHNDTLLVLDELAEVSPKSAAAAAYMLANGSGKVRGDKEGGLQEQLEWRMVFLSAGEIDLATHLESEGQTVRAGQEVRMISLDADQGKGFGVFHNIHEFASSAALAEHLKFASQANYGVGIRHFVRELLKLPQASSQIKVYKDEFKQRMKMAYLHGQKVRVLDRFALVYGAGCLAIDFDLLSISPGELFESLSQYFGEWCQDNRGSALESDVILSQIRMYLQTYGASRFPDYDQSQKHFEANQCSGFRKLNKDGGYDWLILGDAFRKEVCKGLNFKNAINILINNKILARDNSGKSASLVRLPLFGVSRVYCLKASIFEEDVTPV